jgi:hypothetical protein
MPERTAEAGQVLYAPRIFITRFRSQNVVANVMDNVYTFRARRIIVPRSDTNSSSGRIYKRQRGNTDYQVVHRRSCRKEHHAGATLKAFVYYVMCCNSTRYIAHRQVHSESLVYYASSLADSTVIQHSPHRKTALLLGRASAEFFVCCTTGLFAHITTQVLSASYLRSSFEHFVIV